MLSLLDAWFLGVITTVVRGQVQPLQQQCAADTPSVGSGSGSDSVQCLGTCASSNPSDNTFCFSASKSCAFCGDVPASTISQRVASGYTVHLRPKCSTTDKCETQMLILKHGYQFEGYTPLTIQGGGGRTGANNRGTNRESSGNNNDSESNGNDDNSDNNNDDNESSDNSH